MICFGEMAIESKHWSDGRRKLRLATSLCADSKRACTKGGWRYSRRYLKLPESIEFLISVMVMAGSTTLLLFHFPVHSFTELTGHLSDIAFIDLSARDITIAMPTICILPILPRDLVLGIFGSP